MLRLHINGKPYQFEEPPLLIDALTQCGFEPDKIAVAINMSLIKRHQFQSIQLKEGDELEVLSPVQGG